MTIPEDKIGKRVNVPGRQDIGIIVSSGTNNMGRPGKDFPMLIRFETGEYSYYDPDVVTLLS